jgi:hypothetical protein
MLSRLIIWTHSHAIPPLAGVCNIGIKDLVRSGTLGKVQIGKKRKFDGSQSGRESNSFRKLTRAMKNHIVVAQEKEKGIYNGPNQECN